MTQLALLGGTPAVTGTLRPFRTMGPREADAVREVIESDCLSGFYGSWGEQFMGGPKVQAFEKAWAERFKVAHAISVNSNTSGLMAAMGAIGISPGDEVIVPPYTMSATAMAPLVYGGIPVFADIEPETFCIDPKSVEQAITPKTRAIFAVNLFGHPARLAELRALADARGLYLIEDNAQGPLAMEGDAYAGTVGHIGIFSLNYHKHVHTGEGGVCVTDDPKLALRLQAIRNHAENIVEPAGIDDLTNMVGFNLRMTELSAAVGLVQLERIDELVGRREQIAARLTEATRDLEGFTAPKVRAGCRAVSYVWTPRIDPKVLGVDRALFAKALAAEGFPIAQGYVKPLYMLPLFRERTAIGREHFPFTLTNRTYQAGLCPVAELMHTERLLAFETCAHDLDDALIDQLADALRKVHGNRHELARAQAA